MQDYTRPKDMSDDQLAQNYENIWHKAVGNYKTEAEANILLNEINYREMQKVSKLSRKISYLSLILSVFAILFAGLSAFFSFVNWQGDLNWQQEQINELRKINKTLNSIESYQQTEIAKKDSTSG